MIPLRSGKVESSVYALACRDTLGLGTQERVTLYFTESALRLSTTRTDEQLDAARAGVLARVAQMRAGLGRIPVKLRHRGTVVTAPYPGLIR